MRIPVCVICPLMGQWRCMYIRHGGKNGQMITHFLCKISQFYLKAHFVHFRQLSINLKIYFSFLFRSSDSFYY